MRLERQAGIVHLDEQRLLQEQRQREVLAQRGAAFRSLFSGPRAEEVLEDLEAFCFAKRSTADAGTENMLVREGRRQVWLHIQQLLR